MVTVNIVQVIFNIQNPVISIGIQVIWNFMRVKDFPMHIQQRVQLGHVY